MRKTIWTLSLCVMPLISSCDKSFSDIAEKLHDKIVAVTANAKQFASDIPDKSKLDLVKEVLEKDRILSININDDATVNSSNREHIAFLGKNIQHRKVLLIELDKIASDERSALAKKLTLNFLTLENEYCRAAMIWHVVSEETMIKQMQYQSSGRGGPLNLWMPDDDRLRYVSVKTNEILQSLLQREPALIAYGWIYVWDRKKLPARPPAIGKPIVLDDSQWNFVQQNSLTIYKETDYYYMWSKIIPASDGTRMIMVALKGKHPKDHDHPDGVNRYMWASKKTYFLR